MTFNNPEPDKQTPTHDLDAGDEEEEEGGAFGGVFAAEGGNQLGRVR